MITKKRVLLLEDDRLHANSVQSEIEKAFGKESIEIKLFTTESQFIESFDNIKLQHWDAAIIDLMVPWADPAPNMQAPPEQVRREGYFRAGARCAERLYADAKTKHVPRIVYTILDNDSEGLPPNTTVIPKEAGLNPLIQRLKTLLGGLTD